MKNLCLCLALFTPYVYATEDVVSLKYNWQPGMNITSSYQFTRSKTHNGQLTEKTMKGKQTFTTKAHSDGLQIDSGQTQFAVTDSNSTEKEKFQKFMEKILSVTPSYVINPQGKVTHVLGLEQLRTTIIQELEKLTLTDKSVAPPKVKEMINNMLSEENSLALITKDWQRNVGQWVDATLKKDELYEVNYESAVPLLANVQIPTKGQYQYLGKVKCHNKDNKKSCAKLVFQSTLDETATAHAVSQLIEKMGAKSPIPESFQIQSNYKVEVITEYDTLRPHHINETQTLTTRVQADAPLSTQNDHTEITYEYR